MMSFNYNNANVYIITEHFMISEFPVKTFYMYDVSNKIVDEI